MTQNTWRLEMGNVFKHKGNVRPVYEFDQEDMDRINAHLSEPQHLRDILEEAKKQPKKESLSEYKETIEVLRNKGYTWRDISKFLNDRGVETDHTKIYRMMQRVNKMKSRGSYKKLKDIAADNDGKMEWNESTKHWEITINSKTLTYTSNGGGYIRELDSLYVPLIVEPKHYSDHTDILLQDAEKVFLSRFSL